MTGTTTTTVKPATLLSSGTHQFPRASLLLFVATLAEAVCYGVYSSVRGLLK